MKKNLWEDKGDAFYVKGDFLSAIKMYKNAFKSNPNNLIALKKKAQSELQNNNHKDALETHYQLLERYRQKEKWEQEILTLYSIGKILIKLNQYPQAIEIYRELVGLHKKGQNYEGMIETYIELAWLKYKLGEYEESINLYQNIFDMSKNFSISIPNKGTILYKMAKLLFLQERYIKAFKHVELSINQLKKEIDNLHFDDEIDILHKAEQLKEKCAKKVK